MSKAKDVASKGNSSSKQIKHKSAKNKGVSSLKNVSSQNANNASSRIGVAAVALASTLSMVLPGATALAKTSFNADSFDSSYVKSVAKTSGKGAGNGKSKGDGNDLYKNGLLNTGATSERAMRQMVGSVKEYLVKHADSNASPEGVDNQEAAAGDSSVNVKDSGERSDAGSEASNDASSEASNDAGSETGNGASFETGSEAATETATKSEQDNSDVAKPKNKAVEKEQPAEVKPAETPASKTDPAKSEPAKTDSAKTEVVNPATESKTDSENSEPAAKTDSETKTNSSAKTEADQKSAQPASTETAQPENAQTAQSASTQNTQPESAQNTQPVAKNGKEKTEPATENTDSENTAPAAEQSTSTESAQPTAKAKNDSTTTRVRNRRDTNQNAQNPNNGGSVTPADNAPETPSASAPSAGTESSAGVGATANTDSKEPSAKEQGTEGNANGAVADRSGEGANGSNSDSNANSQVIKPNEKNQTAKSQNTANSQVQTDKKPTATYNLQIRYTIGGAPNKQLVQPYELTIDKKKLDTLDKAENYVYVKLPQSAGYRPAIYHSGDYQYYIEKGKDEKGKNKYVVDDGTNADAVRYLRINKKLITEYAVKKRQVVGGNNSDQTSQNPSSSQASAEDGIQYYGELNINYAPKTAKYYIRHMLQDADNRNEFKEDKNVSGVKTITVGGEQIHVTEVTGTVGSNVSAVSVYIPGYEPEHNLISSPLSDSEDEKDKLVLNLRYYRKAYDVTYDSAGGTDVTAQKVYYDQKIITGTKPTKRGYTLKGWQIVDPASGDSAAGTTSESSSTGSTSTKTVDFDKFKMPDHDVKLRAVWVANNTTSYRVNVWVQKADLVDKDNPNSLANYDFVGLVERKNVKTGSSVDLDNMSDAGVAKDTSKLNGASETNYVESPELGLTREELQGTEANDHEDGLIAKFNWMNDTHVTSLDGYNTDNPGAESNYLKDSNGNYVKGPIDPNNRDLDNRVYKDLFTRYFKVNKKLTKRYTKDPNNTSTKLSANDLDNTFDLVYDRKEYELIFAKPAGVGNGNNAAIKRKDENGKTTIYCYAGGGDCSDKYDEVNEDDHGAEINHNGYRVKVRYGQSLTDIWPDVDELDFNNGEGSLGWQIGYAGGINYRDTPPYRFTKKEFADPRWRAVFDKNQKDKVAPSISGDPEHNPQTTYELKDNQRLLTADTHNQSTPIQVIIRKQSIASAKKGGTVSEDDYELSTDSYSKDDTPSNEYDYPAPSIAGFNPADGYDTARVGKALEPFDFEEKLEEWYNESHDHGDWDDLSDDEQKAFAKEYHLAFRKYRGVPVDEQEDYTGDDAQEYTDNKPLEFRYDRQSYDVQFYNADGKAITKDNVAATDSLPYEYSLTKRGNDKLTGEDADLYYNKGAVKSYDASVVKDNADDTSKQFDGKYTFKLNGKTYSIVRPADLPEDYVFKGWAVDQAGIHLINGEINDNSEGAEGGSKSGSKAKGEVKDYTMPVNGIKLYAAWGKPEGVKHTVTLDYDMPEIDENGKEVENSHVVTETKYPRYQVIDENKLGTPTRKGYDFYGWELAKKGNETLTNHTPYAFGNKVVEDITLRAVWVKDTRYNGTFKHVFLKPGVTFKQYNDAKKTHTEAALVDHVSTQTVSGLREHLRYNAEAVYSDETHFPDKHFTSFEASSNEKQNTGEFVYQTYNTRKYKVHYVTVDKDGNKKELLPESEVSSVNQKYDVAFYKPIEGFMPRESQQNIEYTTDDDGKQTSDKEITFTYNDVRVLKRKDATQARPTNYTRYVFKVADGEQNMGSIADYSGHTAGKDGLVYDVIGGTKAYQMPLPQDPVAKQGYEFAGWIVKKTVKDAHGVEKEVDGINRLPVLSETQTDPKVVYTATFKLKAPVANDLKVLTPTQSLGSNYTAKDLIKNANEYPEGATFSFASGATFDSTPGLHKINVQVHLDGNTAEAEVLYRVLPDLVYASDWNKFSQSDYGSKHKDEYVPITFTGDLKQGRILGHDGETSKDKPSLVAYVYKGKKDISVRVPQAFGKEYEKDNYHYVFKGWTTSTETDPAKITNYDIKSEDRYKTDTFSNDVTYHAVYKKIEYFSSSSDGGEVPKDAVVAIFKPAPGRLWDDKTSGPKVFYVKKGTDLEKITKYGSKALDWLNSQLTGAKGTWSRSSMRNDGSDVKAIEPVKSWIVNESFQEFVADQTPLVTPDAKDDTLLAIRGDKKTLPKPEEYIANYGVFDGDKKNPNVESVTVKYASTAPTVDKAGVYTVPLIVSVTYGDVEKPVDYKLVGKLKVMYDLIYGDKNTDTTKPGSTTPLTPEQKAEHEAEQKKIKEHYAEIKFVNSFNSQSAEQGSSSSAESEGTIDGRKIYYAYKNIEAKSSGVKAPQAVGKDYDEKGYHYVFKGWEKIENTSTVVNSAIQTNPNANMPAVPVMTLFAATASSPTVVPKVEPQLYSNADIAGMKFDKDTTFRAHYERVENVIDASQQEEIPDGYVATIFMPGFGRTWADGSHKPKLLYIRHGKDKEDNIKFAQKVASDTAAKLSGFTKWQMYNASGDKSNILLHDNWDISKPRIFVAEQNGVDDVKIPETVIGVGESITNVNKLVHNTDPRVSVSVDSSSTVDALKPGISTIMVNVTKPTDETDNSGKHKTVTTKLPVRVYVLPKVIADNDLPAEGTAAAKFVEKNYTKVKYVAGDGGSLQKSPLVNAGEKPVSVYWVRNDATNLLMQVPDVLANKGYVFKNWTVNKSDVTDNHYATEEEREALARLAKIDGMHYVAKQISDSRKSTFAALQNLLNEARKSLAEQEAYKVYNAKREELAQVAERKGNTNLAQQIRDSHDSLQDIKYKLAKTGIDVDEVIEQLHEKALLVKLAKEAGKEWLAKQISNSKRSSIELLKNLMREAGIDLTFANYEETNKSNVSDEQRELLAEIADEADKPSVAKIIRSSKKSSLEVLKQLLRNAGVDLYAVPASEPKKEITITANFEQMDPVEFKFSGKAVEGVPATFTLANLTRGVLNADGTTDTNATVSVDNKPFTVNALSSSSRLKQLGISHSCSGTTCTISGTPKIVDGKKIVELTFTSVDKYGRKAVVTVDIEVLPASNDVNPTPIPTPEPTPIPSPEPDQAEPDYSTVPSDYIVPAPVPVPAPAPAPAEPLPDEQKTVVKGDLLPQTGVDASQSALIASLLASVGFVGFAAKHRRKREDGKNN